MHLVDSVSGKLDGALVDWAFYRDGRRDTKVNSYTEALSRARRGLGFGWIGLFQLDVIGPACRQPLIWREPTWCRRPILLVLPQGEVRRSL